MPFFVRPVAAGISKRVLKSYVDPQIDLHLGFMESELAKSAWFAGPDFSAADIQMSFPIEAVAAGGLLDSGRPRLAAYLKRIHERPAYGRALDAGGAYDLMNAPD
jgi:glutathione S-transferase